jgi:hypothetical protein
MPKPQRPKFVWVCMFCKSFVFLVISFFTRGSQLIADEFFAEGNGHKTHMIHAVGHYHIDSAWLWNYDVTKRKCARSWISTLTLMDEYTHFNFACSQVSRSSATFFLFLISKYLIQQQKLAYSLPCLTKSRFPDQNAVLYSGTYICKFKSVFVCLSFCLCVHLWKKNKKKKTMKKKEEKNMSQPIKLEMRQNCRTILGALPCYV